MSVSGNILLFKNCPLPPSEILKAIREDAGGQGEFFLPRCSKDCDRLADCPWIPKLFVVGGEKRMEDVVVYD